MKKFTFIFVIFALCFSLYGQRNNNLVHIGFGAGLDFPTRKISDSILHVLKSTNFELGVYLRIGNKLHGQIGVYDYINQIETKKSSASEKFSIHQIAIPISLGYAFRMSESARFRLFAGVRYRGIVHISNNTLSVNDAIFNKNNGDVFAGAGLSLSLLAIDLSYRKAFNALTKGSTHYQDAIHLSISVIF